MRIIFIKKLGKSLTGKSKRHKKKKGGKHENNESVWEKYVHIIQKSENSGNNPPDAKSNRILLGANSKMNLFNFDE